MKEIQSPGKAETTHLLLVKVLTYLSSDQTCNTILTMLQRSIAAGDIRVDIGIEMRRPSAKLPQYTDVMYAPSVDDSTMALFLTA